MLELKNCHTCFGLMFLRGSTELGPAWILVIRGPVSPSSVSSDASAKSAPFQPAIRGARLMPWSLHHHCTPRSTTSATGSAAAADEPFFAAHLSSSQSFTLNSRAFNRLFLYCVRLLFEA